MLDQFIVEHRDLIVARTRERVAARPYPKANAVELTNGVPAFLDQLCDALERAKLTTDVDHEQIDKSAQAHGLDLLRRGVTIGQVVHDYGDICQTITDLAIQLKAPLSSEEFKTLNLCLDDAIAGAVTEFARQRERTLTDEGTERLGILAHELRNLLNTAVLSFDLIQSGRVATGGATSVLVARSLMGIRDLIDRSLTQVRLDAGVERKERISVAEFIEEVEIGASVQAQARDVRFSVTSVDRTVTIEGDRPILVAAVANLLQNAFKFTRQGGHVSLRASTTTDRVLFEVEDECGGLPAGVAEDLFRPFEQRGADRSGVGLGLAISLRAAKANEGDLRVRDIPGRGCVFTLDLPRKAPPPLTVVARTALTEEVAASGGAASTRRLP